MLGNVLLIKARAFMSVTTNETEEDISHCYFWQFTPGHTEELIAEVLPPGSPSRLGHSSFAPAFGMLNDIL